MSQIPFITLALACLACGPNDVVVALDQTSSSKTTSPAPPTQPVRVTLYVNDPLHNTYDFERQDFGSVIQNGTIVNAGSHVAFGTYAARSLSAGVQGGEKAIVVDLGPDSDVAARLGVVETGGGGQGFASLAYADGSVNDPSGAPLSDDSRAQSSASAVATTQHVYAIRLLRESRPTLVVKLLVTDVHPDTDVTFLWLPLR